MNTTKGRQRRFAGVIDGDNLTGGGRLAVATMSGVLRRIAAVTDGCPVTYAMQSTLAVRYMTAYSQLGWGVRFASMAPDAADQMLLEAAEEYVGHDVTDLVVASGDHAFAELAGHVRLHVFSFRGLLSHQLELAATSCVYLDDLVPRAA
jgi:hypothetical protein